MKKIVYLFVLEWFAITVNAQIQVGARTGIHWSTLRNPAFGNAPEPYSRGWNGALLMRLPVTSRWAIRAEPALLRKGWLTTFIPPLAMYIGPPNYHLTYWVAALPLLAAFRFLEKPRFTAYGLIGPSLGYVFGNRIQRSPEELSSFSILPQTGYKRRIEADFWLGGGLATRLGRIQPFIDVRYQWGLSSFPTILSTNYTQARSRGFSVSIGCWLPSKKS